MPFRVKAIQVDGGAGAFDTSRPNQALGGQPQPNILAI